ncbi:hypothetical protein J1N35_044839 [Gossypium stocksii]|uniref:Reverse transcriptase zinc-binding domain-containing protein n=1 Tax=Gossypium stocksii TaxID=47602 RepID=A0A9D3UA94_9ROSI|nr:hypothetical protein J1N35_044839 [Gossypium stocksii]
MERVRRGIDQDPSYLICGHGLEDILHVCTAAKEVWLQVVPGLLSADVDRPCLFGLIAWHLWKNKNLFIFQGLSWNASEIFKVSLSWARKFLFAHKNSPLGSAFADGVLQDQFGDRIVSFYHALGDCSIFYAKLWASEMVYSCYKKGGMIGLWFKQIA